MPLTCGKEVIWVIRVVGYLIKRVKEKTTIISACCNNEIWVVLYHLLYLLSPTENHPVNVPFEYDSFCPHLVQVLIHRPFNPIHGFP